MLFPAILQKNCVACVALRLKEYFFRADLREFCDRALFISLAERLAVVDDTTVVQKKNASASVGLTQRQVRRCNKMKPILTPSDELRLLDKFHPRAPRSLS